MLKKILKNIIISSIILISYTTYANTYINPAFLKKSSATYGYLYAQNKVLDKISQQYPDLSGEVLIARTQFNLKFPNLQSKAFDTLNSVDYKIINNIKKKVNSNKKMFDYMVNYHTQDRQHAINFINLVKQRANGKIESPHLENILAVHYNDKPYKEMFDGFYNQYSSKGAYKAKGVEVKLNIPKSWQAKEANRPNIVKKWIGQNKTGVSMIMLLVKNTGDNTLNPTINDINNEFYNTGEIYNTAPTGFHIYNKGAPILLDGQAGYWVQISGIEQRLTNKIYANMIMYNIFYKGKLISLQCFFGGNISEIKKVNQRAELTKPLCESVANSLTLPQKYY